ncbi:hypothetical protein BASA50_008026 [Batrachochytrium salamandrivorans]|uniref:F-box domain-containing protein n=1 Tax=Batrachochytrium salamandrivorans TaxID=1357716 RepID=A0ABQ8F686_9FUNG|nr:hypothetical protein BASA62_002153 [Batrachochytrium salamandrivorans]KAH6582236.1 hypothetical protein BASA60_001998 [Batrachochytrium salamandrivorans]KAH6585360.1 hypothetical protein BASA61_006898 [Batrachochytrium salamandrivorans]KAH6592410.1 hypothetical protein BASA50_008026 [Batrachochytrium salamandrivorans]KAH9275709.1 hypothetical protein BASA83_002010 [Batrachochytrium salamandrivorans]
MDNQPPIAPVGKTDDSVGRYPEADADTAGNGLAALLALFYDTSAQNKEHFLSLILDRCGPRELRFVHTQLVQRGSLGVNFLLLLPIEIAQKILGIVDITTLGRIQQTCRIWNSIASTLPVWKSAIYTLQGGVSYISPRQSVVELKNICHTIRLRDQAWRRCRPLRWEIHPHSDKVTTLKVHNHILVSGSYDRTCSIWDLLNRKKLASFETYAVSCLDFSYENGIVATGSFNRETTVWSIPTGNQIGTIMNHSNAVLAICVDGDRIYSGGADTCIFAWNWKSNHLEGAFVGHHGKVSSLAIGSVSNYGGALFSSSYDGTLNAWNSSTFQCIASLNFGKPVQCMDLFSPTLAVAIDQTISLFDVEATESEDGHTHISFMNCRKLQPEMSSGTASTARLCVAVNCGYVVSYGQDLTVWGVSSPTFLQNILERRGPYSSGALALDNGHVITGESDGRIHIFYFS